MIFFFIRALRSDKGLWKVMQAASQQNNCSHVDDTNSALLTHTGHAVIANLSSITKFSQGNTAQ